MGGGVNCLEGRLPVGYLNLVDCGEKNGGRKKKGGAGDGKSAVEVAARFAFFKYGMRQDACGKRVERES